MSDTEREARTLVAREKHLARKYGLTLVEFEELRSTQQNHCAICSMEFTDAARGNGAIAVDHDHRTGRVRGLLCFKCNAGIGYLRDSAELLRAAVAYLDLHNTKLLRAVQ